MIYFYLAAILPINLKNDSDGFVMYSKRLVTSLTKQSDLSKYAGTSLWFSINSLEGAFHCILPCTCSNITHQLANWKARVLRCTQKANDVSGKTVICQNIFGGKFVIFLTGRCALVTPQRVPGLRRSDPSRDVVLNISLGTGGSLP